MLKILFSPQKAKRHPFEILMLGFVYSSISILFASWIFPEYASIAMVFLTVFSCLYLIQGAFRREEDKERDSKVERWLLKEHSKILTVMLFLFLGFTLSFTFWSFVLPTEKVSSLFFMQETIVDGIRETISGNFLGSSTFAAILGNNLKVLIVSLIFALFYGAGAIYVLVWNASVMGFVIGNLARNSLGIASFPVAFSKYFIHGIPEMFAYLTTALAGGILYVALVKGDFAKKGRKKRLLTDVLILITFSVLLLIIAALIEVYISPYV
jgi:stage II sporulation protein M